VGIHTHHRGVDPTTTKGPGGACFAQTLFLRPLDLDNLSRREIPAFINGVWFGLAFRSSLGIRLNQAGVNDKDIQSILRHADVSITKAYDILPNRERAVAGMKRLDKTMRTKYGIKAQEGP
jgi:integrase